MQFSVSRDASGGCDCGAAGAGVVVVETVERERERERELLRCISVKVYDK